MDSIKNSMRYLQLGVNAKPQHNHALRKWHRVLWYATLYVWRTFLFFGVIYLIAKLIY
jgi:hypothetical protein